MSSPYLKRFLAALFLYFAAAQPAKAEAPFVVATIPPIHSLTAMVMDEVGRPHLLLDGAETPHSYALRPSQSRMLASAEIVIRVGDVLEGFLRKPLRVLSRNARIVNLVAAPGLVRLTVGGSEEVGHGHRHAHGDDHAGAMDPHIWLHTGNAETIVASIAKNLSEIDSGNARTYSRNAARAVVRLRALKTEIDGVLFAVKSRPFVVFHDAWQYFSAEYGLRMAGALTVNPERKPGARRLADIRARIRATRARCVFAEPQFPKSLVRTVIRGTPASIGVLDPLGVDIPRGPVLYPTLMRSLARDIASCLNAGIR